ncbi:hypothetical protein [Burkholderia ubonensis]|uniref:hypothetical protein n=1 Tax=Burkholderia ubonensis TaxID=101571 RepID=UPI0012FAFFC7|nr:hypothetical protein [Burkholderia ubonensis]
MPTDSKFIFIRDPVDRKDKSDELPRLTSIIQPVAGDTLVRIVRGGRSKRQRNRPPGTRRYRTRTPGRFEISGTRTLPYLRKTYKLFNKNCVLAVRIMIQKSELVLVRGQFANK